MSNVDDHMNEDKVQDEFSLESILAEYKGSAFINGEKKTPKELLDERADEIVKEAAGSMTPDSMFINAAIDGMRQDTIIATSDSQPSSKQQTSQKQPMPQPEAPEVSDTSGETKRIFDDRHIASEERQVVASKQMHPEEKSSRTASRQPFDKLRTQKADEKDSDVLFFDNYRSSAEAETQDTIVRDVEKAIAKELGYEHELGEASAGEYVESAPYVYGEDEFDEEDYEQEEPDLKDAVHRFAVACNSISLRRIPAALVTMVMVILTFSHEAGLIIPFGIGHSQTAVSGVLIIGLLLVMMLCADILVRGALSLIRGAPNAETLIFFSCVFSFISAAFIFMGGVGIILPYCAVSALTLTFAAFGEKFNLRAITETLKTASSSSEPYGVQAEYNEDIDKSVLKKAYNRTDGFYRNLMHPDISELIYRYAAPILIGASLVLSLIAIIFRGGGEYFLQALSGALAAAAPFSLLLTFSVPFGIVSKSIRRSGAALAGWGGADDICFIDGASVTDEDLFPPGTMSLSGLKLFDGTSPEKAIRYTSSLINASGSGLRNIFTELLKTQAMNSIRVEDFACYEGGISALLRGERVATGSGAFMNLLGVRVPDDTNIKSAVYTAVNNKLIAMFTVDYTPINSVQSALISMLKWRMKLFFAVRDFNVTPLMLEQKFRVSLDGIEYVQTKDSYTISDSESGKQGRMAAILTREGLGPFAEAITGGRLLKASAFVATVVSVGSAALGVMIMFYMFWSGAVLSARPGNLVLFMLSMLAAVLIVCGYVKCKK